jgi:hypothetical protein
VYRNIGKEKANRLHGRERAFYEIKKRLPGKRKRFIEYKHSFLLLSDWETLPFPAMPSILLSKDTGYLSCLLGVDLDRLAPENSDLNRNMTSGYCQNEMLSPQ